MHLRHLEWKIAMIFLTQSLYENVVDTIDTSKKLLEESNQNLEQIYYAILINEGQDLVGDDEYKYEGKQLFYYMAYKSLKHIKSEDKKFRRLILVYDKRLSKNIEKDIKIDFYTLSMPDINQYNCHWKEKQPEIFWYDKAVTISKIGRTKVNEAPMVYIVGLKILQRINHLYKKEISCLHQ